MIICTYPCLFMQESRKKKTIPHNACACKHYYYNLGRLTRLVCRTAAAASPTAVLLAGARLGSRRGDFSGGVLARPVRTARGVTGEEAAELALVPAARVGVEGGGCGESNESGLSVEDESPTRLLGRCGGDCAWRDEWKTVVRDPFVRRVIAR